MSERLVQAARLLAEAAQLLAAEQAATEQAPAPPQTVFTVASLAELLGRSRSSIRDMARDGRLLGHKLGRSWLFPSGALDQLFASVQDRAGPTIAHQRDPRLPQRRRRASAPSGAPADLSAWRKVRP